MVNNSNASFNGNHSLSHPSPSSSWPIFKLLLLSFLMVSASVLNALIITVIVKNKHLRKSINCFILSMAISDLFIPAFAIPHFFALTVLGYFQWLDGVVGNILCKLVNFFSDISPLISNMCLVFMTFDRFIAIVYPTKFHLRTATCRKRLVILSWVIPAIYCSKNFYSYKIISDGSFVFCGELWAPDFSHSQANTFVMTIYTVVFVYIPLIVLTVMYSAIIFTLRKQQGVLKNNIANGAQRNVRQKQRQRVITLALAIIFGFIVCYGPINSLFVMGSFKNWEYDSSLSPEMSFFFYALGFSNATVNPLICMVFHKELRVCLTKMIGCDLKCFHSNKTFNLRPNYELETLDFDNATTVTTSSIKTLADNEVKW